MVKKKENIFRNNNFMTCIEYKKHCHKFSEESVYSKHDNFLTSYIYQLKKCIHQFKKYPELKLYIHMQHTILTTAKYNLFLVTPILCYIIKNAL